MHLKLPIYSSCTGCLACIDICPSYALQLKENSEGFMVPECDRALCIFCHKCERICPVLGKKGALPKDVFSAYPVGGWSLDNNTRLKSASGGIFAELARSFIEAGGFVAGAVIDGMRVRHIVIDSLSDLPRLQGSKYLQSDTTGVYARVKSLLNDSKLVLFSGTPCQIAGLKKFLGSHFNRGNLLLVEILCHGIPSGKLMEKFLETEMGTKRIISFRDKQHGWQHPFELTISNHSGEEKRIPYTSNYFSRIFLADNALRRSCYSCNFSGDDSCADLTLGDFWGVNRWPEEQKAGVSVVIIRSVQGEHALSISSHIYYKRVDWSEVVPGNPCLYSGKSSWLMRWHPLRVFLNKNIRIMPAEKFLKLYSGLLKLSPKTFLIKIISRIFKSLIRRYKEKLCKNFLLNRGRVKSKKILQLTFHSPINYGAILQTYALGNVIRGMGHSVRLLNLRPDSLKPTWSFRYPRSTLVILLKFLFFLRNYLPPETPSLRDSSELTKYCKGADAVVVGSDQVWNPEITSHFADDYFLKFVPATTRRVAYAASFGLEPSYWLGKFNDGRYATFLKDFDAISIRESSGIQICQKLAPGVKTRVVLDPTLLLTKEDYTKKFNLKDRKCGIVSFKFEREDDYYRLLKEMETLLNDKVTLLCCKYKGFSSVIIPSPKLWMEVIAGASFVVTDSFHGMCFAIIFQKDFIVLPANPNRICRMEDLLKQLGLIDRLCYTEQEVRLKWKSLKKINYQEVEKTIDRLRSESIDYLKAALL
jgi:coenzyme F420-reducing hydrogenase beta subunit